MISNQPSEEYVINTSFRCRRHGQGTGPAGLLVGGRNVEDTVGVDLKLVDLGVAKDLLDGLEGRMEEVLAEPVLADKPHGTP